MTVTAQMLAVWVPLAIRQRSGRKVALTSDAGTVAMHARVHVMLVMALARTFRWLRMLETGRYGTIADLAAAEKNNEPYVSRVLRLTSLAPDIVEAILDGRQPDEMTLPALMEPFPAGWVEQRVLLSAERSASDERGHAVTACMGHSSVKRISHGISPSPLRRERLVVARRPTIVG